MASGVGGVGRKENINNRVQMRQAEGSKPHTETVWQNCTVSYILFFPLSYSHIMPFPATTLFPSSQHLFLLLSLSLSFSHYDLLLYYFCLIFLFHMHNECPLNPVDFFSHIYPQCLAIIFFFTKKKLIHWKFELMRMN